MNVRAFTWPTIIVGMLLVNVGIVAFTVVAAQRGGGAAVSPAYDERALHWDDYRRSIEESNALGWNCQVTLDRTRDHIESGTLTLSLSAGPQRPVSNTLLRVQVFHSGHPTDRTVLSLETNAQGTASARVPTLHPGYYSLHIESPSTTERATWLRDVEVLAADPEPETTESHP
jgi:hypothetical protein